MRLQEQFKQDTVDLKVAQGKDVKNLEAANDEIKSL